MMSVAVLFLLMLLAHIVEDFHLQGKMADMKQKTWWHDRIVDSCKWFPDEERPEGFRRRMKAYGRDYVPVLILHGFEWAICVSIPVLFYTGFEPSAAYMIAMVAMALLHSLVDHMKCNMRMINLIHDQAIHVIQVVALWAVALMV